MTMSGSGSIPSARQRPPAGRVRKAVIPVAGLGTRLLPVTRAVPKAMLPVLDTPLLHYVIAEASAAGIEQFGLIVSPGQESIGDYFTERPDLKKSLEPGGGAVRERMRRLPGPADVTMILQERQLGLGHAVAMAREFVGREPFAVLLPDDLFWGSRPAIACLIEVFERFGAAVIAVEAVEEERIPSLGIIDPELVDEAVLRVRAMVEKPRPEDAPSNLGSIGRYVFTADVFDALDGLPPGANGEIQLTDAIAALLRDGPVFATLVPGVHVDAGTPVGLLRASAHEALRRADTSEAARAALEEELGRSPT